MRIRNLLIAWLILVLSGAAGLFAIRQKSVDVNWRAEVENRLQHLVALDASINESSLKTRYSMETNYDALAEHAKEFLREMRALQDTVDVHANNETVVKELAALGTAFENKEDILENFKSHNSVLRNSLAYAPAAGRQLVDVVSNQEDHQDPAIVDAQVDVLEKLVTTLLSFGLSGSAEDAEEIKLGLAQLPSMAESIPEFATTTMLEFENHARTVVNEKPTTDRYLNALLSVPIGRRIESVQTGFGSLVDQQAESAVLFRNIAIAVLAFLAFGTIFLAYRLRDLYTTLDAKVAERTGEIESAYRDLERSQEQLVQSEKMATIGSMVAGVAHEINTPLGYVTNNIHSVDTDVRELGQLTAVIDAMAKEMSQPKPDGKRLAALVRKLVADYKQADIGGSIEEASNLLGDCRHGLASIDELVKSLREFSRTDMGDRRLCDVTDAVQNALRLAKPQLADLKVETRFDDIPQIECSPSKLSQVFINLIVNAVHATDGEGTLVIGATHTDPGYADPGYADPGYVTIAFADDGVGIEAENCSRIFDPFFTTKDVGEGTGLGLSIAAQIVKSHGGTIEVDSSRGQGATFSVNLPLRHVQGNTSDV